MAELAPESPSTPAGTSPVEITSEKGNKYIAQPTADKKASSISSVRPKETRVHMVRWPVGNVWEDTDSETRAKVYVQRYNFDDEPTIFDDYRLTFFTNTPGLYLFMDGNKDLYEKKVYDITGDHFIEFNSKAPVIIRVEWSSWT